MSRSAFSSTSLTFTSPLRNSRDAYFEGMQRNRMESQKRPVVAALNSEFGAATERNPRKSVEDFAWKSPSKALRNAESSKPHRNGSYGLARRSGELEKGKLRTLTRTLQEKEEALEEMKKSRDVEAGRSQELIGNLTKQMLQQFKALKSQPYRPNQPSCFA